MLMMANAKTLSLPWLPLQLKIPRRMTTDQNFLHHQH
jgi:hypothetical protein